METTVAPFEFKQCVSILKSTGKKARSIYELKRLIAEVSEDSIFHHTYQYFIKGHILEYSNDFAHWAGESLEERNLAERLSSVDPYSFRSIKDVRKNLIRTIDDFLKNFPAPRDAITGNEFYFNETVSLIFSVGIKVKNIAEFLVAMEHIEAGSIYFHFYEARVRLGGGVDDFSRWIQEALGLQSPAEKIRSIDPFMHNIERIRERIIAVIDRHVRADMEGMAL